MGDRGRNSRIRQYLWTSFVAFAGGLAAVAVTSILDVTFNNTGQIDHFSSLITGIATLALVGVTYRYVRYTRQLVDETKQARSDEQQRRRRERNRELMALRRGLLSEIQAGRDIELLDDNGVGTGEYYRNPVPTTIYEQNTDRIGRLTDDEIEAIVEYYHRVQQLEDQFYLRNETTNASLFGTLTSAEKLKTAENDAIAAIESELNNTDFQPGSTRGG